MSADDRSADIVRQPVRGGPIEVSRPPLDWGDEEPDEVWEALYLTGAVNPPYLGRSNGSTLAQIVQSWTPIGDEVTDDYLMCALGRCDCCQ